MKQFSKTDIQDMPHVYRLNFVNSLNGYKSANLIGTKGKNGENLAIFSSVIHLGSNPPLLGLIMRPTSVNRHSYDHILETGHFTINQIERSFIANAHYTSAKFDETISEFEACHIKPEYLNDFSAPFVKGSRLKMGMRLVEEKEIESNGTRLLIGEIEQVFIDEKAIEENGQLNLNTLDTVCISGLNRYHEVKQMAQFPYARVSELPDLVSH